MACEISAATCRQRLALFLDARPALLLRGAARHARRRWLRHARRQWLCNSCLQGCQRWAGLSVNLFEGSTLQGVAGARRVGRPLRGGQLGVRPLGGPFVSGRVLVRRPEDRRVRVEHSVRRVLRCVERARPLNNDDDKKKIFPCSSGNVKYLSPASNALAWGFHTAP